MPDTQAARSPGWIDTANSADVRPTGHQAVSEHFTHLLAGRDYVTCVGLVADTNEPCLWVVIDAEPFEREPRDAIYDAYFETLDAFPDAKLDLRLVNVREYGETPWHELVPARTGVLFRR